MGPSALLRLCLLSTLALHPTLQAPRPLPGVGVQRHECPPGWLELGRRCYGYFSWELSWREAQGWCRASCSGCGLASLHGPAEHRALAAFIAQRQRRDDEDEEDVWIGLYRRGRGWRWLGGSDQRCPPRRGDEDSDSSRCAALEESTGFLSWEGESCGEKKPFLCQRVQ
ncbi:dromaiocalcin-1-like [Cuculus canorus]|uniref:dromaiocalcin-1-like n=1 Tax=Cuculus canorus TaxID=55661 RepID=UPI0023AAFB2B|nr:dromaiocalcin-1-like [Cuculus canorus]